MEHVKPKVIHLASTSVNYEGETALLGAIGAENWETDAISPAGHLIELAGRLCYRSFKPGLNENVTKVRKGNREYINNILKQAHGSVLEHATDTFAIINCSRVFTHEIVRHRLCAFSQESLRYVRLTDLKGWIPTSLQDTPAYEASFDRAFKLLELIQKDLASLLDLDSQPFDLKKKLTSAMRRLAPIGLATSIIVTTNHRNWRHMIAMRTSEHAEEEIRLVMAEIADILLERYPNIYQDMEVGKLVDDVPEYIFNHGRV